MELIEFPSGQQTKYVIRAGNKARYLGAIKVYGVLSVTLEFLRKDIGPVRVYNVRDSGHELMYMFSYEDVETVKQELDRLSSTVSRSAW